MERYFFFLLRSITRLAVHAVPYRRGVERYASAAEVSGVGDILAKIVCSGAVNG